MFFDKDRIQLLGLFDFLPLTDEDVDSNLTLIDYRLTVRDLQIAYIKNVILKMLGGQAQFGPGTPISDYFSSTGLSQVLGSTLSGEEGSEIYNRLDEVLYSNQIFQNAIKQLSQVKLDPTGMAAEAVFYWDGSGLENIPTQSDLEDFFGNYCNITGTPNTQENFDNTPISKMYLQLLIDTQSSINHYYPSMLGLKRDINPASYI